MRLALLISAIALTSCAAPYGPSGESFRGGYETMELIPGVWQVRFRGNAYTSLDRASDFAMLRAAEICLERGFTYVALLDEEAGATPFVMPGGGSSTTFNGQVDSAGGFSGTARTSSYGPTVMYKPRADLQIACQDDAAAATWDAGMVSSAVRAKYGME